MKIRHYTFLVLLLSALTAFADKKMTIRNADTGESFEVTVPDGMRIYEYNSNWLDSIPYLMERAKYGEPWAYEALGDCYRHGNGGVERSIFKALVYYDLSGADIGQKAEDAISANPNDLLGLTYKMVNMLEQVDNDGVLSVLGSMKKEGYEEANDMQYFICEADTNFLANRIESNIMSPDASIDKIIFSIFGCCAIDWFPESLKDKDGILTAIGDKLPYLYDVVAVRFLTGNKEGVDSATIARKSTKSITFLEKADKYAMLSRRGASILYGHYQSEMEAGRMELDMKLMDRLATVARLPESERIIFSDN